MLADIERVLISQEQIAARVAALAKEILADHRQQWGDGDSELTIVPILTGAMIFCCDLIRHMPIAMRIGLFTVSSYPARAVESKGAQVVAQQLPDLRGRRVLLVDDILDSGNTLKTVVPLLESQEPASLKTCVLLRKARPAALAVPIDYVGFEIPDEFVVGYGLDYNNYYRNLPDLVTLKPSVLRGSAY